ncbi:gliding motility-associated C-terminal domain-containing protein [Pontibacter sp. BT213]|uniref:Gliding motility-associated C-terminal domain-containing protein n=2 Tax=Pontibacter fetidus TaxID=2700082 RepID=A0A6B2H9G7_9BACT|nr:gliding motility-associated C-terminal domain-containing protein [Pontibacter fetidus]
MIMYTDRQSQADDPFVDISLGDGNTIQVQRNSVTPVGDPADQIDKEVFRWEYTYGADGTYTISWNGINRNPNILNITPPSDQLSFYISTTINISALRGFNSTPILTVAPIDKASVGKKWVHNPGAYDREGDSLSFKLRVPLRKDASGNIVAVPGYTLPDRTFGCRNATNTAAATFTLNMVDGQLVWDAPCRKGEYNVAFVVEEWRVTATGGKIKLGEVVRDMQILVVDDPNNPPVLEPLDTCVVAGTTFTGTIRATDVDKHLITLTASGGILLPGPGGSAPRASFTQTSNTPGLATGRFTWSTECLDVRERPYQVIFRAEDQPPTGTKLADLQPWNIRVVGPPPQNLRATGGDRTVTLNWDSYVCQNAEVMYIYRREGPSNFVPDNCETGVPSSTGYVRIGEVRKAANGSWATTYTDANNLKAGVQYCYTIYAEFPSPGRGKSIASREVCIMVDQDIPYLTNVSVFTTSTTAGVIDVKWTQPRKLDKLTPPFQYRLYRKEGQADATTGYVEIVSVRNKGLADTTFRDTGLNTVEKSYRYKLEFYQSGTVLRDTTSASSVFLTVTPSDTTTKNIVLNWTYNVPWRNDVLPHTIYRREGTSGAFVKIAEVKAGTSSGTFTDAGTEAAPLERGKTYCYYVQANGTYQLSEIKEPLQNNSQQVCAELPKLVCAPILSVDELDCDAFLASPTEPPYQNVLTWVPQITGDCTADIKNYTIYFKGPGQAEYTELAQVPGNVTTYTHTGLESFAGCYVVTATDVNGNESEFSNEECKDNCFFFMLPNIITPNGDGKNEVFRPDEKARFIKSIKFTVFNRWGVKVYEGNDKNINWPGTDSNGNRLNDGVYYYEAQVEFFSIDPANTSKKYKGWVEIVR